jgi:PAP2 superfamily
MLFNAPAGAARWLSVRHSLVVEAVSVLALYATYEAARGLVAGNRRVAIEHAHAVASLERKLNLFVEPNVQHAISQVPLMLTMLGSAYLTLHLSLTAGVLVWLHQRRPTIFPQVRTTLLAASGLALIGFVSFPTAPPRLAGVGVHDTVSNGHVNLNKGLISSLYNPFAAIPSMHIGYALIVAAALSRLGSTRTTRIAGVLYPVLVLLVIVATGNHFFFDAAAGVVVAAAAYPLASAILRRGEATATEATASVFRLPLRPAARAGHQRQADEDLAA